MKKKIDLRFEKNKVYPGDNNLYIIRFSNYRKICLWKIVNGKRKHIKCTQDFVGLASLLIKDYFEYFYKFPEYEECIDEYQRGIQWDFGSKLSDLVYSRSERYDELKICGLYIRSILGIYFNL